MELLLNPIPGMIKYTPGQDGEGFTSGKVKMYLGVSLKYPSITLVFFGMTSSNISRISLGEYSPIGCVKSRQSHDSVDSSDAVLFVLNPKMLPSL